MKHLYARILIIIAACLSPAYSVNAINLSLDSIAAWGKFPRFCINTYRWGDRFFNTYDSAYVVGTGTKFNVKLTSDSWMDTYHFMLPNSQKVEMWSDPSTSVGAYLTYLAVSVGYDINISNLFGGVQNARSRYRFGFDCSLLSVETYIENNDVGTRIKRFGPYDNISMPFDGVNIHTWGIDVYYFFNHKKYSQAAAFSFSKVQKRSQGSLYAGLSIYSQNYDFDFSALNSQLLGLLPSNWKDYHYKARVRNYGLRIGYGYNWVFARNWVLCGTLSPTVGIKKGFVNSDEEKLSFSLYTRSKISIVWNKGRWFVGAVGKADVALVSDRRTTFLGTNLSASAAIGYRFNLW